MHDGRVAVELTRVQIEIALDDRWPVRGHAPDFRRLRMSEAFAPVDIIIAKRDGRNPPTNKSTGSSMPIPAASSPMR